ncbi:MAG: ABC transporter ATP-binding protein [Myxococcaceae bacterium]|nr:MAG: ABC transporter ATP-binding protein [Myxococcaceae bacterium]
MAALTLAVEGLSLRRNGRLVLDGVTFEAAGGEVVALIGPNGAGKTTLLECLTGLQRADRGTVAFGGAALTSLAGRSAVFAYMPDDAEAPAELTVREWMAFAARVHRTPAAKVRQLSERLRVAPLLGARAGDLSRGERRRVALCTTLCAERPVVVLDEPLGVFDPRQLRDVLAVLQGVAAAGAALVVSVHQMSDAEKIADRVMLLAAGRVVAFGSLPQLRAQASAAPDAPLEAVFLALLGGTGADAPA